MMSPNRPSQTPPPRCCTDLELRARRTQATELAAIGPEWADARPWAAPGETALELACGAGEGCLTLAEAVGPAGRVIGVEQNRALLRLAEDAIASRTQAAGQAGDIRFHWGRLPDLRTDLGLAETRLAENPIDDVLSWRAFEEWLARQRGDRPLIASRSVDLVLCNWALNPLGADDKARMIEEARRVLAPGGRMLACEIVADGEPPGALRAKPDLWPPAVAGAMGRERFVDLFARAGFGSVEIVAATELPAIEIKGVLFHAVKVLARA